MRTEGHRRVRCLIYICSCTVKGRVLGNDDPTPSLKNRTESSETGSRMVREFEVYKGRGERRRGGSDGKWESCMTR